MNFFQVENRPLQIFVRDFSKEKNFKDNKVFILILIESLKNIVKKLKGLAQIENLQISVNRNFRVEAVKIVYFFGKYFGGFIHINNFNTIDFKIEKRILKVLKNTL